MPTQMYWSVFYSQSRLDNAYSSWSTGSIIMMKVIGSQKILTLKTQMLFMVNTNENIKRLLSLR